MEKQSSTNVVGNINITGERHYMLGLGMGGACYKNLLSPSVGLVCHGCGV
jgi:hypothetical protein